MRNTGQSLIRKKAGQSLTESVMLMPIFLAVVFALLQVGHLGVGVAVVYYATSSVGKLAVQNNDAKLSNGDYQAQFARMMVGGLTPVGLPAAELEPGEDALTPTITVTACAKLPAYPLVGETLKTAMSGALDPGATCTDGPHAFGPVHLAGNGPYFFVIRGQTTVRLNYQPRG